MLDVPFLPYTVRSTVNEHSRCSTYDEQLKEALRAFPDSIRCVDASWHLGGGRDAQKEFAEGHLPGAVFFDIDDVADKAQPLPHM